MSLLDPLLCMLGKHRRCETIETDDGIGGVCLCCRRVFGWMWDVELRALLDGAPLPTGLPPAPAFLPAVEMPRARARR